MRVLLTNDDGPPGPDSPFIFGFYRHLVGDLGWDVKVVIPSTQKSWIGGAFHINETIKGEYYYPRDPDGSGERSKTSRPLKDGETSEWVLLDGTPATCTNVALYNLYPGLIDLVISGPNFGRNSSAAFALSSGTVGAAISSSLCRMRSIAISYGIVERPPPTTYFALAHNLSGKIISHLWHNWGKDEGGSRNSEVDLYNVNIPLVKGLLSDEGLKVVWTSIWRNSYARLFKKSSPSGVSAEPGGPDAHLGKTIIDSSHGSTDNSRNIEGNLIFKFSPEMTGLINPPHSSLPVGSDAWAFAKGWASVTPLRASFAEPPHHEEMLDGIPNPNTKELELVRLKL
ncbi:sure-like protein [Rickenella mellea]|uniref:Sure-like protein n=1 Tax=Rickenella mellea TaxID=50990 RepID=A0A4Y7QLH0_9AGAM|nr:sure-like protein [Rickenella mellea]